MLHSKHQNLTLLMLENAMAARGRPTKMLTTEDLIELEKFLADLHYLKKNQQQATMLLHSKEFHELDEKDLSLLKIVHREKIQFEQRQTLIEQIKLKEKNQQPLLTNEIEILGLLQQEMNQDLFFRLDRALESYQKIEKAALDNRIRLENEHKREILQKSHKELTEAQKKRNAENQLKYALGGAVLSAFDALKRSTENIDPEKVRNMIVNNQNFYLKVRSTELFQYIQPKAGGYFQSIDIFIKVLEELCLYEDEHEMKYYILETERHINRK